ncbi:MAG: DUF3267 domain-containing protein [Acetatifactor sp.]|nr:DUF3267 domain-containing protein [Acetatifactor sp.]
MAKNKEKKEQTNGRKLTKAEQRRLEAFRKQEEEMLQNGYEKKDLTTSALKANTLGCLYGAILALIVFLIGYAFGARLEDDGKNPWNMLLIVLFLILVVVHELIHGITWGLFAKGGFKKNIEFGFIVQYMTPYCTCKAALKKWAYVIGSLMPCIVLGIGICVLAFFLHHGPTFFLGALMIVSAGGDLLITQMILMHKTKAKEVLYMDHPTDIGLVTFEK